MTAGHLLEVFLSAAATQRPIIARYLKPALRNQYRVPSV